MIADAEKLRELVEELAEISLADRREYLSQIAREHGEGSAEQLRQALRAHWETKR